MRSIRQDLVRQFFGRQAWSGFLRDDGDLIPIDQQGRSGGAFCVGWDPFIGRDLIEFHFQEGTQQIL